jgi:hypothetical protein
VDNFSFPAATYRYEAHPQKYEHFAVRSAGKIVIKRAISA